VTRKGTLDFNPAAFACSAIEATRDMSSYDEFVHDPIRAEERVVGYLFDSKKEGNRDRGVARSGVNGPFRWGSSSDRFCLLAEAKGRDEARPCRDATRRDVRRSRCGV